MLSKVTLSTFVIASIVGILILPASAVTVCEFDSEAGCAPHQAHTGCGSIESWAQSACKVHGSNDPAKYTLVKIGDRPGGQCGYAMFEVTCK